MSTCQTNNYSSTRMTFLPENSSTEIARLKIASWDHATFHSQVWNRRQFIPRASFKTTKTTTKALIGFHNPYFWILRHLSSANKHLSTFESKQTLRQQIKKQTFPKATFQRILRILLGNQVYHTEDAYRIAKGGALVYMSFMCLCVSCPNNTKKTRVFC